MDFIHSDYAVVNERLASHYKIPGTFMGLISAKCRSSLK